jgi:DNA-binding response OmpR family regulator
MKNEQVFRRINRRNKILMIDEDNFLRKVYRDKLQQAGFDFLEAPNGIEGVNKVFSEKPDLILLDLILPLKNGFDVLSDIKRDKRAKKIPIIILSNLGQESDIERGKALGVQEYLVKTDVGLSEVVTKVKEWLLKK